MTMKTDINNIENISDNLLNTQNDNDLNKIFIKTDILTKTERKTNSIMSNE
jgi:hypothetical protein